MRFFDTALTSVAVLDPIPVDLTSIGRRLRRRALWLIMSCFSATILPVSAEVYVTFETTLGDIVIAMDDERAPLTTEYFLGYIQRKQYDGATLYRSASLDDDPSPQIVQGGIMVDALNAVGDIRPEQFDADYLEVIEATDQTGLRHERGAISFARDLLDTGFVIPEIVFCLRDVPAMDAYGRTKPDTQGFPVAGRVVSGMEVIEGVTRQTLDGTTRIPFLEGQILSEPIVIKKAYIQQSAGAVSS